MHDPINAWAVNKRYGYERRRGAGPTWCFDRLGRTTTALPDGRTVHVAGEHEDYYDPDFYIYNDVVVVAPDQTVAIYGYPRDVFPPTDFHTATLDGSSIWIVGSLGYPHERRPGTTQVCRLDLETMAIEQIATTGDEPGWIHKHEAQLENGAIVVRGGIVDHPGRPALEENIDEWALELATRTWTRRTARDWQRWAAQRADGERGLLWELRQLKWKADHPEYAGTDHYSDTVRKKLGAVPDLALLDDLYRCEGAAVLPGREGDDYNVYRIELDGVIVRFTEENDRVAAIVEGEVSDERLRALQDHVVRVLSALHFTAWELEPRN